MVTYDDWGNEKPAWRCQRVFRWVFWTVLLLGGIGGAAYGIYKATHKKGHSGGNSSYGPVSITTNNYTFNNALSLSLQFLNGQKSGKLPVGYPIKWRGDSCLQDGSDVGLDLTGGLYDAGDHIKFGLPMAFTATILSWGVLEYGPQMQALAQLSEAVDRIKWITDYIVKAHPSPNVYYFQVGDPDVDHKCWQRAEDLNQTNRPSLKVDATNPGSDVAGEAAAALAAASIVFRRSSSYMNTTYADLLLTHSRDLFKFADTNQGLYTDSFPAVQSYYNSTGFQDDLLWAAAWLYQATEENTFMQYVTGSQGQLYAAFGEAPLWLSWDDKRAGVQVLLSRNKLLSPPAGNLGATQLSSYKSTADKLMCALIPNSPSATNDRTKGGMIWVTEGSASIETVNAAFLALVYSDYLLAANSKLTCSGYTYDPDQLRHFAFTQVDYLLGSNPAKTSYLVGYGNTYSKYLHHRGASIPENGVVYDCKTGFEWLSSASPNPNVAYGGLVGGPGENDTFKDDRQSTPQNEAATYNSATLAGLVAGLSYLNIGGVPRTF